MSRGKKAVLVNAVLALAVVSIWASPTPAALTMSGSVAAVDDRAPAPVTGLVALADLSVPPSVGLTWVQSESDFVRQGPAGLDLTSGGTFVNTNDVAAYDILRDDGAGLQPFDSVGPGASSFVDDTVLPGVTYTYQVIAVDAAGNKSGAVQSLPQSVGPPADPGAGKPDLPTVVAPPARQVAVTVQTSAEDEALLLDPDPTNQEAVEKQNTLKEQSLGLFLQANPGLDPSRVTVRIEPGSIVIIFEVVDDPEDETAPTAAEAAAAFETLVEDDPETVSASLDVGPVLDVGSLQVGALDFGNVAPDASPSETFSFSNSSTEADLIVNVTLDGDGYSVSTASLTIAAGASGSFDISFVAADVANANGSYPGSMTVFTNDPENLQTVILMGAEITTGLDAAGLVVSDDDISFGTQVIDAAVTESFSITNSGGLPLEVTLVLAGDDVFTVSSVAETLLGGDSADISVVFTAAASISYSGTITITTDDPAIAEATVALSGIGAASGRSRIALSDAAVAFGAVLVGGSSSETVTISNTGGADLTLSSIGLAGDSQFALVALGGDIAAGDVLEGSGGFSLATIAPGGSVDITAVFTPGASISYTGTITIGSNDPDTPATVALSGSGEAAPTTVVRKALDADGNELVGFLNDDDVIDLFDFFKFADSFGKEPGEEGYEAGADFDQDGDIDLFDFFKFADSFGKVPVEFL